MGVQVLLALLDEAYEGDSWHGPTLGASIRRVKSEEASWRPSPSARNVWEITLHSAYWKYAVARRFTGEKRGAFPRKGSNWFTRPSNDSAESWTEDVKLLDEIHRRLRSCVESLNSADLDSAPPGSSVTNGAILRGIALHDVYHAGQIQTLRQMYGARKQQMMGGTRL